MVRVAKVETKGPLFQAGMLGVFQKNLTQGLLALDDEFVEEVEKRFKRGKGLRTGALQTSFGEAREIGTLRAGAHGKNVQTERYYHRVEYGAIHMKGQNQRKNARLAILRSVKNPTSKRGQMVIKRAVEALNG